MYLSMLIDLSAVGATSLTYNFPVNKNLIRSLMFLVDQTEKTYFPAARAPEFTNMIDCI